MDNTTLTQIVRQQEKIRELEAAIAEKDKEIERLRKDLENKNFLAARMYQFTKNGGQRWLKNRSMSR